MSAVTDWFDNLDFFGTKKQERATAQIADANARNKAQGDAADARATESYNKGQGYADQAQDWIQTGGQSGKLAGQGAAQVAGTATGNARSAGLNAAQAAKMGGQQGANSYNDIYGKVYGQGMQGLSNLSGQELNSASAQGQLGAQSTAAALGTGTQQQQAASGQTSGSISGLANTVVGLLSDETKKKDIKSSRHNLEKVYSKVKPYRFAYKEGNGQDDKEHLGVMAQDLEKTPLHGAVLDTPEGKKVDTGQLTMGNTAMIGELNEKLDKIMKYVKRGM